MIGFLPRVHKCTPCPCFTPSENAAQMLLEKAQAEAVAAAQNGADSAAQPEIPENAPAGNTEPEISLPSADTQADIGLSESSGNKPVPGYDSPENILPDGSRIDDEMFFLYEESLLQPAADNAAANTEPAVYPEIAALYIHLPEVQTASI